MLSALLLFVFLTGAAQAQLFHAAVSLVPEGAAVNKTLLLKLVNYVRAKGCQCGGEWYGPVAPLSWSNKLETAAAAHSLDMVQKHYFSHTGADGSNPGERIEHTGYAWRTYGENIAEGYANEQEAINGWLGSPPHCKNIMSKDFTEMGVGRANAYWTQAFAAPLK